MITEFQDFLNSLNWMKRSWKSFCIRIILFKEYKIIVLSKRDQMCYSSLERWHYRLNFRFSILIPNVKKKWYNDLFFDFRKPTTSDDSTTDDHGSTWLYHGTEWLYKWKVLTRMFGLKRALSTYTITNIRFNIQYLLFRGQSITTWNKLCPVLTIYPPRVDILHTI